MSKGQETKTEQIKPEIIFFKGKILFHNQNYLKSVTKLKGEL